MRVYSSSATLPVFLSVTLMITSSAQSISRQEQSLPAAVSQLLRERPLPAEAPNRDASGPARAKNGPPADDAPIDDLIEYWSRRGDSGKSAGQSGPSDVVRERLLGAAERRPWILPKLYDFLPQNTDTHDRLYKILTKDPKEFDDIQENNWRVSLYWRLQSNTEYLRNELIEAVRTRDNNDEDKLDEIEALARLDWPTAKPLLEKIVAEGRSLSYPMALSRLYMGAMKESDTAQADIYREILKRLTVEDDLPSRDRRTVLEILMREEWVGQEEWFISLFSNPNLSRSGSPGMTISGGALSVSGISGNIIFRGDTLSRRATGNSMMRGLYTAISRSDPIPLSIALSLDPDRWMPVIAGLTNNKEPAVRNAAISSLVALLNNDKADQKDRKSAARALLPWLTDPDWSPAPGRADLIISLSEIDLPESAPGLLWVLDNDENDYVREAAVEALTHHCDPRTAPTLISVLPSESNEDVRWQMVNALARCGGFSDEEMAAAVAAYASLAATAEGQQSIKEISSGETEKTLPANVIIGKALFESDMGWATEGFAATLFDRLKELSPGAAKLILDRIRALPLNIARVKLIERIASGSANLDDLKLALRERESLVEDLRVELSAMVKRGEYAGGIAAMVMEDRNSQIEILKGKDVKAQIALLAGARYLIEKLPIELLRDLIASSDKTLAQAVENYLEVEGGAAARKLTLSRRPNEKQILGDISCLAEYQKELGDLKAWEEKLLGETPTPGGAEEIYALAPAVPSKQVHYSI